MDPDACLEEIRDLVKMIEDPEVQGNDEAEAGINLSMAVEALDEWISKGGRLPKAWT